MNGKIKIASTDSDIKEIVKCARTTWHDAYDALLPDGQVEYMLKKYQSFDVIKNDINNNGYRYYLYFADNVCVGFCGVKTEETRLFVSKIYVLPDYQRHGIATELFERVKSDFSDKYSEFYLTVNKHNDKAIAAYKKFGFFPSSTAVTDIGGGYVMDDYIMTFKA